METRLLATRLSNRLEGGGGADMLYGGAGDDTYIIGSQGGKDNVITDDGGLVRFDFAVAATNGVKREGDDLILASGTADDSVSFTIKDYYADANQGTYTIEQLSNGEYVDYTPVLST